jgi:ADP-ribose pyrophosphatase
VQKGLGQPRPVDAPWMDRPKAFTARQGGR